MASCRIVVGLFVLLASMPFAWAVEQGELPKVTGRISDHAAIIGNSQKHLLYQMLAQHEFGKKQYVAIVTAETSGGDSVQADADQIWQQWEPRRKSTSVLLLLVKQQKRAAIVAGEGLREILDAAVVKKIIDEAITPPLSRGDFDSAALEGVKGVVGELNR